MYSSQLFQYGVLTGEKIILKERGWGIPMHSHEPHLQHIIIIISGSVICYGPNKKWYRTLYSGDIFNFTEDQQEHEIIALEDNTIFVNILKTELPFKLTDPSFDERLSTTPVTLSLEP